MRGFLVRLPASILSVAMIAILLHPQHDAEVAHVATFGEQVTAMVLLTISLIALIAGLDFDSEDDQ